MAYANNSNLALYLLGQHERKEINDAQFLREFGKVRVYHSTPFGDHKDGGSRLFLLPAPDNTAYLPVFTTEERAKEFFEKAGRTGYLLMTPTFHEVLVTTKKINEGKVPVKMGITVDPGYYGITVEVTNLDAVINLTS